MKKIFLTQNKIALVDDEDFEWLSENKWYYHSSDGYAARKSRRVGGKQKIIYMRVEILKPRKGFQCDHVDLNKLNNCRSNLREATHAQNKHNQKRQRNNTSGYKGVTIQKRTGKFISTLYINNEMIRLGYFDTAEDAALAYDEAAVKYHEEFARTNFHVHKE